MSPLWRVDAHCSCSFPPSTCVFMWACLGLGIVPQQLWSIYTSPIANTDVTALFKGKCKIAPVKKKKKACLTWDEMSPPHLWIWLQPWTVRFNIPSCLATSCQKWPARCHREANSYSEIYYTTNPPLALRIKSKLHLSNDRVSFCRTALWYLFALSPWVSWSFQWAEEVIM